MTSASCPTCGASADVGVLPEVATGDAEVLVRLNGLARATCANGHVRLLPVDAHARTSQAVHEQLLLARRMGLVRRRDTCGACGTALVLPPRHTDTPVPFDVDGQVVTVVVEAPMARCPECGREQLPSAVARRVDATLRACVEAASPA